MKKLDNEPSRERLRTLKGRLTMTDIIFNLMAFRAYEQFQPIRGRIKLAVFAAILASPFVLHEIDQCAKNPSPDGINLTPIDASTSNS